MSRGDSANTAAGGSPNGQCDRGSAQRRKWPQTPNAGEFRPHEPHEGPYGGSRPRGAPEPGFQKAAALRSSPRITACPQGPLPGLCARRRGGPRPAALTLPRPLTLVGLCHLHAGCHTTRRRDPVETPTGRPALRRLPALLLPCRAGRSQSGCAALRPPLQPLLLLSGQSTDPPPPPPRRPRDALSPAEPPGPAPASPWFLGLAGPPRTGVCRGSLSKSRVQATVTACQPSQHCQSSRELGNQSGGNIGNRESRRKVRGQAVTPAFHRCQL